MSLLLAACGAEGPSAQPAGGGAAAVTPGTVSVFDDALGAGWQDWSWATVNLASAAPVASGTRAISVTFAANTGLYFHRSTASVAGMSSVNLAVNGGATAGAHLALVAVSGATQLGRVDLGSYCAAKVIPQNAWTRCQVPLAAVNATAANLDGFWIQEADGTARPAMAVDEVYLAPAAAVPAAPANLTAAVGAASVALSWSAVSGATGYDVWRAAASAGPFTRLTAATQAGTAYGDAAVAAGTTYWYRVTASNAAGTGAACTPVSATVPPASVPAPPPGAPTGVVATASAKSIAVTWNAFSGASGYGILRATQSGGPYAAIVSTPVAGTSWTDTAVTAGTTYWYEVMAAVNGVATPASAPASATVPASAPPPAAPAGLSATAASGAVSLSWGAVSGATGYDVWRATAAAGPFTRLTAASQAATTYRDAAVTAGSTYWYQATATSAGGTSAACAAVSVTVPAPAPGPVTVAISPTSGAVDACGGRISFVSTVTGSTNTIVTWSVQEGAAGGTVSTAGLYTAPATGGTYHVIATSAASSAATATATVTVSERVISVTVSPASLSLAPGATGLFTSTVTTSCGTTTSAQAVTAPL